ncbi:MAG: ABC transporter permease [Nocardioides sp.]
MFTAAWKSLLGRKLRLLMSTFAIVLGVAFVAGSMIFTDTLARSFDAIFASSVGDVVVRPVGGTANDGSPTTKTMSAAVVADLAGVEGAARADGNVTSFGVFVVGANGKVIGGQGAPGIGLNWTDAPAANGLEGLTITDGDIPGGTDEVVLDAGTAERAGYELGDTVQLVTSGTQPVLRPTLVGVATFGEGGSTNGATLTIFDTATSQDLFTEGEDVYNDAWVTSDGLSQAELRDNVAASLPEGYEAITGDQAADDAASDLVQAISFISTFLLIFAGISLVVGSFLIVNTFSILVAQRSRELALLRALGASRRQVTRSVLFEAVVLGLVGSTIGLGLGVLLAMGIRALFAAFGLDLSGTSLVFAPRTVLAAYVVGVVVTVAAAYIPARRSAKIPPVAALRDDVAMPESSLRRRLLAGVALIVIGAATMLGGLYADVPRPGWWVGGGILAVLLGVAAAAPVISKPVVAAGAVLYRRAYGTVGNLAGQNALRNPRRTAATASALMIGLALVTTMSILGSSAKASVDASVAKTFSGDLVVSNVIGVPFSPAIADRIEETDGVMAVSRLRYANASFDENGQSLMGIQPETLGEVSNVPMLEGSVSDLRDGTMLIGESVAEEDGLSIGDDVEMTFPGGKENLEVVGIYEADNQVLFFPYTTTIQTLEDAGFQAADNYLLIGVEDGADAATVQTTIEGQTVDLPTVTVKDQAGYAEEQRAPIDQLLIIIYALLGLALIIAILGIVNTLALSVIERTREVGLLRAVGLSRRQLRRMIRLEAVVIAILGAVLGVGMGLVFGIALMTSLADEGLEVLVVPGWQLFGYVVAAALVGVLAAVFPARRAARLDVLTAIATE